MQLQPVVLVGVAAGGMVIAPRDDVQGQAGQSQVRAAGQGAEAGVNVIPGINAPSALPANSATGKRGPSPVSPLLPTDWKDRIIQAFKFNEADLDIVLKNQRKTCCRFLQ